MTMGMLLLSLSVGLIALGIARILRILRERRAYRLRSDFRSAQMFANAQMALQRQRVSQGLHPITGQPRVGGAL